MPHNLRRDIRFLSGDHDACPYPDAHSYEPWGWAQVRLPKQPLVSNDLFTRLGNPWISERDRSKDFDLSEEDNPDMDQFTKATFRSKDFKKENIKARPTQTSRDPEAVKRINFLRNMMIKTRT
jgi:hypothetical protein